MANLSLLFSLVALVIFIVFIVKRGQSGFTGSQRYEGFIDKHAALITEFIILSVASTGLVAFVMIFLSSHR